MPYVPRPIVLKIVKSLFYTADFYDVVSSLIAALPSVLKNKLSWERF